MSDLVLAWPDVVFDLQDRLADQRMPVYIVGGAVRDALLRRPVKDIDMAVPERGIGLARKIANAFGGAFFVLDGERDVGRALIETPDGHLSIDVAGFRGSSLDADLRDRDFTVNALAVDLTGDLNTVIDPTGGARDVLAKTIRRCSPDAIASDPIRMLRAVRQSVQFGFRIEPETLADIRAQAPHLLDTSIERVRDELFKLLALSKPGAALRVADRLGLLTPILPELAPLHDLQQHPHHAHDAWNHTLAVVDNLNDILMVISPRRTDETAAQFNLGMIAVALDGFRKPLQTHCEQVWPDERQHRALLMLAALLHDVGKGMMTPQLDAQGAPRFRGHAEIGAEAVVPRLEALHLSNAERERITALVRHRMGNALWRDELTPVEIYRFWKLGAAGIDLIFLTLADYLGVYGARYNQDVWLRLVERAQTLLRAYYDQREQLIDPPALINGTELMRALGLKPGPQVGALLERIREAQVSGEVASAADALHFAQRQLGSPNDQPPA